jgi:hypothetical protein
VQERVMQILESVIGKSIAMNMKEFLVKRKRKKMIRQSATIDEILGKGYTPKEKMKAIPVYDHKTGSSLMYIPESQFKTIKAKYNRRGYGSNLGRIMG